MNAKKYLPILFLLAIMVLAPVAFAEDNSDEELGQEDELDEETEEEIGLMVNQLGAEYRYLQLERAVTKSILSGAKIVELITVNHSEEDVNSLNAILDEMEILLEDIQNAPREGDLNEIALAFVEMKKDAGDLVKEFREITREILTPEDKNELRSDLQEIQSEVLDNLREAVGEAKRTWNANRTELLLEKMGISNVELVAKVLSGESKISQVKNEIKEIFRNIGDENKNMVTQRVREESTKRKVLKNSIISNAKNQFTVRVIGKANERIQVRAEKLMAKSETALENGFENRSKRIESKAESLELKSEKLEAVAEKVRNKRGEKSQ